MKNKFFIITTIPGSLNFLKGQIKVLSKYYQAKLLSSPGQKLKEIAKNEEVTYKAIAIKRNISLLQDFKSLWSLWIYFRKEKPYIIHCNTPKASLLALLSGKFNKTPIRFYYVHGLRYEGTKGLKRKLLIRLEKVACWAATDIIAVSNGVKKTIQNELTSKPVKIIHNGSVNGINTANFHPENYNTKDVKTELNISKDDFIFGFLGRIVADKGINELIAAFSKINSANQNTKLILVGRYEKDLDPLQPQTLMEIEKNPAIIKVGYQTNIQKYLSVMDIFVSPSYREGFGVSLLEANIMGKPVIASNITGYNEIVKEGSNGFLIPPRDEEGLQLKMQWSLKNKEKIRSLSQACIDEVKSRYEHSDVLREALKYYKSFLPQHN